MGLEADVTSRSGACHLHPGRRRDLDLERVGRCFPDQSVPVEETQKAPIVHELERGIQWWGTAQGDGCHSVEPITEHATGVAPIAAVGRAPEAAIDHDLLSHPAAQPNDGRDLSPAWCRMRLEVVGANVILDGAGVSLGGLAVLRGISLSIGPAEVVGIAGPNGSGKTTLLRLLATLARPDEGSGRVLGATLGTTEVYAVRHDIGLIGHVPALIHELSLRENLEHAARLAGDDVSRIDRALRVVGLEGAADRKVGQSSHGMLRRAEAARLLLTRPRLLLLDEAFSGLDTSARDLVDALVERSVSAGGSVVMVSHDATHLASRADRVMTISSGRIEASA